MAKPGSGFAPNALTSVILLDHNMPGEDGLVLLNEIGGPDSPAVIMITAHGSEQLGGKAQ